MQNVSEQKTIIMLHAFPLSSAMWKANIEPIKQLGYKVINPDFRGFGNNQDCAEISEMVELATDISNLMNKLEIDEAIMCGLSMGGYVALKFARMFPGKVSRLILCDTTFQNDSEEKRQNRFDLIDKIEKNGTDILVTKMLPNLISEHTKENNVELVNRLIETILETNPTSAIAALKGMAQRQDHTDILDKIDVPVLLIFGEDDKITNFQTAKVMNERIKYSKLKIIKNAGHYSNLENPDEFNQAVLEFIST